MSEDRWKGVTVENAQVAATIRRYGAPAHTRPVGPNKTVIYYENPDFKGEAPEPFEDQHGKVEGRGTRNRIEHSAGPGTETISSIGSSPVSSGAPGQPSIAYSSEYANPSEVLENAPVEGEVDPEFESRQAEAREGRDREAAPGGYRPSASLGGVTKAGPATIDFLEGRDEPQEANEEEVEQEASTSESAPESETEVNFTASPKLGADADPRSAYREKYPERTYEALDAMGKAELEAMYESDREAVGEVKGTGANGAVLRADLIKALRTDR